jgi:hypothetical protein
MSQYSDQRYHVTLGKKRTTVNLDNMLSILLSLQLGQKPQTPRAHSVVRQWLQARLDDGNDPGRSRTSQWLNNEVIQALITPKLEERYGQWVMASLDK